MRSRNHPERRGGPSIGAERLEPRLSLAADLVVFGVGRPIVAGDTTPDSTDGTDFGAANVAGDQATHTFVLKNVGDAPLVLQGRSRVAVVGPNREHFRVLTAAPKSIAAGGEVSIDVRFDPASGGVKDATLSIASNDADAPRYAFTIRGTGVVAPRAIVSGGRQRIAAGDATPDSADGTDFGSVAVAGQTVARRFVLRNTGSGRLDLVGPRVSIEGAAAGDFRVVAAPAGSIAAGGASAFRVEFRPTAAGLRSATVAISTNDPAVPVYRFAIQGTGPAESVPAVTTQRIANGLPGALFVTSPPSDTSRLFVVQKGSGGSAAIRVLRLADNSVAATPFLAIDGITTDGERGLLGMAFDPGYATNGRFYVALTNGQGDSEIRRYTVSAGDPDVADPNFTLVLHVDQPYANHNGGWIGFGPDGYLYVALGDGGGSDDPQGNAQNLDSLLGKILRLDVNGTSEGAYGIPAGNPFVGRAGRDEIWAYGLRNPWRCSFDRGTGDLWIGDVGQNAREEIDRIPAGTGGLNFGWRAREGSIDNPSVPDASPSPRVDPVFDYAHPTGESVTGGFVYRGTAIPSLAGYYLFADFITDRIWGIQVDARDAQGRYPAPIDLTSAFDPDGAGPASIGSIASFGEDASGNLYVVSLSGSVYRVIASE